MIVLAPASVAVAVATLWLRPGSEPRSVSSVSGSAGETSGPARPVETGADGRRSSDAVSARPPLDDPPDPGPAPSDHGLSLDVLAAAVGSSVRVSGTACRGIVHEGSGFATGGGDLIVTIAHLMVGMHEPSVELADGRVLDAVPVAIDLVNDLAVLRAEGAGLVPLPLSESVPDGTVGAMLAWEDEGEPDPTPFRIDRPVTVRTEAVAGRERIERPSWLLAADVETGDSGAALAARIDDRTAALGVVWSASRRGGVDVAYATRAGAVEQMLAASSLRERVDVPPCP